MHSRNASLEKQPVPDCDNLSLDLNSSVRDFAKLGNTESRVFVD